MNPQLMQQRPPYVRFEMREVEDREASIKNEAYSTKEVAFALITPSGSKDIHEKIVQEWFEQMRQFVREERFPPQWLDYYEGEFDRWKRGLEPALNGTDVREWPVASPSQRTALRNARLFTVEDLAEANEEAIARLGMGGRDLKERALAWLSNSSKEAVAAKSEVEALKKQLAEVQARLEAQAAAAAKPETKPTKL